MFIPTAMNTMASKEPERQAIITKTATFLRMGGEVQKFGTTMNAESHKQLGEMGQKNRERARGKKLADARKFHV